MSNDDKKYLTNVPIDPMTHDRLVMLANKEGVKLADLVGEMLDEDFYGWQPPNAEEQPGQRAMYNEFRVRQRQRLKQSVYTLAAVYKEDPTEENADILAEQCELAGLDYKEVVDRVGKDPFSSLIAFSRNGSKAGDCIKWLSETMRAAHDGLTVQQVKALADERGFKMSMVNRCKRAINNDYDSPNIVSERQSTGWVWTLSEDDR